MTSVGLRYAPKKRHILEQMASDWSRNSQNNHESYDHNNIQSNSLWKHQIPYGLVEEGLLLQ